MNGGDWVVLLGPRRVGKTSLSLCTADEISFPSITIDARQEGNLTAGLLDGLKVSGGLSVSGGVSVPITPISVSLSFTRDGAARTLENVLGKVKKLLIILDEGQWLRNTKDASMLLAHIYDYYHDSITFIITGSSVGVMQSIINPGPKGPMFGRAMVEMELKKWREPSTSFNFLKKGCEEDDIPYTDEQLSDAVKRLDGLPGWLTLYGFHLRTIRSHRRAMSKTITEGLKIVRDELESVSGIARGWERQIKILRVIAGGRVRFRDLLGSTELTDAALARNLEMLRRLQYVEKDEDGGYGIVDPMVMEYIMKEVRWWDD